MDGNGSRWEMRLMTRLLFLLLLAVATLGIDRLLGHAVFNTVGGVYHVVEDRLVPGRAKTHEKHRGSGAVSVMKTTDFSKPGGGVISEDESWMAGLDGAGGKPAAAVPAAGEAQAGRVSFKSFKNGQWVTGVGTVKEILPDEIFPVRHQRFILEDGFGNTVLMVHDIQHSERVSGLMVEFEVAFRGMYKTGDGGGVIQTHPDGASQKDGGWVRRK